MRTRTSEANDEHVNAVLAGSCRISRAWTGLRAEYSWLPPYQGAALTKPNRVEVVFSAHDDVVIDQQARAYAVRVQPGGMYVVGQQPTTLLRVGAHSDTLELYPDFALMQTAARERGVRSFELEPTLRGAYSVTFAREPTVLGIAHVMRRACMNQHTLSDLEADLLAHRLVERLITLQHGELGGSCTPGQLSTVAVGRVADCIEAGLTRRLSLAELAHVAGLSAFHFARCFKATTSLAPHQYALARRIELAKRLLMTTKRSVQDVAWSIGFENLSHFRRQFEAQVGVVPGVMRLATGRVHRSDRKIPGRHGSEPNR